MAASCASGESSSRGRGCTDAGACEASGGMDIRDARGAEVCGIRVASGSQGAVEWSRVSIPPHAQHLRTFPRNFRGLVMPCGGASCLGSFVLVSALLLPSVALVFSPVMDGPCLRSGLLTLDTMVSRVVTVCLSVRRSRSSVDLMLFVRGLPDSVLLWAGRSGPDAGESAPDLP